MRLVLSRRAARRLREIADYIHERNPAAAAKVQQGIRDSFALLLEYPEAGRATERGVRRFAVPRLPYLIYYKLNDVAGTVNVVTVLHSAMHRED